MATHRIHPLPRALLGTAAAALLLLTAAAGCGDDDDGDDGDDAASEQTTTTAAPAEAEGDEEATDDAAAGGSSVIISGFTFSDATVAAGAEVTVENQDEVPHTVTADDDSFDSGRLDGGGSGTITAPSEPGAYPFHCEVHPDMAGTLTVEA